VGRLLHKQGVVYALAFLLATAAFSAAWAPFAPVRLFDFDASNFALALDSFQPRAHQPQPPGYPLYVGLTNLIHFVVSSLSSADIAITFLVAGILGSAAAVVMLGILGYRMFGLRTGICAALLLATNPILWQTAMSDQVRIYIAVISIGVALVVWPGWQGTMTPVRFTAAGFALGVLTGFRPEMLVSMAPLAMACAFRSRLKFRYYLLSAVGVAAGMAPWLLFLLIRVGGVSGFLFMMKTYSTEQAGNSSVLFGASWMAAWRMVASGLWWLSLGLVAWVPALLFIRPSKAPRYHDGQWSFLLIWFGSLFAFSIAIHIAASGHALGFIPVVCIVGGWVLSLVGDSYGRLAMCICATVALSLNVYFFFKPYASQVREASYPVVDSITSVQEAALDRIDALIPRGPVFLVSDDSWVRWRILQYYYPENALLYIPGPGSPVGTRLPVWLIRYKMRVRDFDAQSELPIPGCGTIVWLVNWRYRQDLLALPGVDVENNVISFPAQPGMKFKIGRYRLATSDKMCPASNTLPR
jgi:hypothetical protein